MIFLVWICLDLVYQLNWMLTIWHKKTMCIGFSFFFWILCPFESWSNPRFDHDLNKFKTWIWKIKHISFLFTPKWSSWEGFWNFHVWNQKPLLFMHAWLHKSEFSVRGRYIHDFLVWICLDLVYQLEFLLYIWHKNAMSFVFSFFWFFPEILCPFESFGQILGLTKI